MGPVEVSQAAKQIWRFGSQLSRGVWGSPAIFDVIPTTLPHRYGLSRDSWVGQRNGHAFAVKVADGGVNDVVEFDDVSEGLVGQLIRLQIVPDDRAGGHVP